MKCKIISKEVEIEGIGIHTGEYSKIVLKPSVNSNSINFIIGNTKIKCSLENVVSTTRCTTLGEGNIKISTVEHLLSVLYCLYLKNIDILIIQGKEIPGLDGSAGGFLEKIISCGIKDTEEEVEVFKIRSSFEFEISNSKYKVLPSDRFVINCSLTTDKSEIINNQELEIEINYDNFIKQIAYAKTFCYLNEIHKLQTAGYGLGGSLENVIVVDKNKILNPEILIYKRDEFVRHKILDFLGDLSLCNLYFNARFIIKNPSHYANIEFCKQLIKYLKTIM